MSALKKLDTTFHIIMKRMVETGQAPHYTDVAKELGISMEEGRRAVHELFKAGVPGWLFPGKTVRVECPCLDCGEPITVEMQDGKVLKVEPQGIVGYVSVPFWKWFNDIPYA
jgi:hypothetical protein